jgi:hypothetical protein
VKRVAEAGAALLPVAAFETLGVLRHAAGSGEDERPRELGGSDRRSDPFGYCDSACHTGLNVDVAADTAGL